MTTGQAGPVERWGTPSRIHWAAGEGADSPTSKDSHGTHTGDGLARERWREAFRTPGRRRRKAISPWSRHLGGKRITALFLGGILTAAVPTAGAESTRIGDWTSLTFRNLAFRFPSSWPVIDLSAEPSRCVRFDTHAVYLGRAGTDPSCPARLIGKTEAMHVEPLDVRTDEETGTADVTILNGEPVRVGASPAGETTVAFDRAGLLVTISRGRDDALADEILASLRAAGGLPGLVPSVTSEFPSARPSLSLASATGPSGGVIYTGEGFDTCTAPSAPTMSAWLNSPYRSVGVYIGGASRACAQPNLTSSWVSTVIDQGWTLIPTYVGLQAPCTSYSNRIDAANAAAQGVAAAQDAMGRAAGLGMGGGSPIYFDMEAYDNSQASCVLAVNTFLSAWTGELHSGDSGAFPPTAPVRGPVRMIDLKGASSRS